MAHIQLFGALYRLNLPIEPGLPYKITHIVTREETSPTEGDKYMQAVVGMYSLTFPGTDIIIGETLRTDESALVLLGLSSLASKE